MGHEFKVGEIIRAKRGVKNNYLITTPENDYIGVVTRACDCEEDNGEATIRATTVYCKKGLDYCNYRIIAALFEPLPFDELPKDEIRHIVMIAKERFEDRGTLMAAKVNFPELYDENYVDKSRIEAFDKSFEELF